MDDLFNSINAKPSISWLREQEENHLDQQQIFDFFLNEDLHNTSDPAIDPNVFLQEDYILDSTILVQIDEIIDISLPFIKRKDFILNNSEKKRTLKFLLSDGHFQFAAISKDFLPDFNPRIVPGIKIQILYGTKMKFGILLLEKNKLEIIGGQSTELKNRRHSIVLYDEQKYKEHEMKLSSLDSFNQNIPKKTKKKSASLIITKEEKTKSKTSKKAQFYDEQNNQNTTKQDNILNDDLNIKVVQKLNNRSFLEDESCSNSDDAIEKIESEISPKPSPNPNNALVDQISFSSYSSDVEIINSLIQKQDKSSSDVQTTYTQNPQNKKFLSDDDDLDDFDFEYLQNNSTKAIDNDHESPKNDLKKMKIWTMNDLLKRESMLKNTSYSINPEIVLLDGNIVECNDLKIIKKKNTSLFFSMNCKIACGERTIEIKVASKIISDLLESTPEAWMNLDRSEQDRRYEKCSKILLSFKSPLYILITGINEVETSNRFLIVDHKFLSLI